jgi:hypothetical protein
MQNDMFYVSMRKCSGGTFGGNGVIFTLFVLDRNEYRSQQVVPFCDRVFGLASANQLAVDLGVTNQTADL